jgi:pyrroloquinoline quinone biosynthesis protein D
MHERIHAESAAVNLTCRPALRPNVKLRHDSVRDRWVVLAPERILTPNEQAIAILRLCDGERTVAEIAETLADAYDAEPDAITADILPFLQGLADAGVLRP